jgi:TolB-like protein/class 3 adenylate cyclase/rhodanese-related sulfurtransferase
MERRLVAVLYADVVDYSRLTGEDELGTHKQLGEALDLISGEIKTKGGKIVHYAGDAVLAEFASVVEALECAVSAQGKLGERNAEEPEDSKLCFRIGINLGDVIVDRDDIYGDGVNIAARLEGLAEPGGICISGRVYQQVENKLKVGFEYLGEKQVKNIEKPIRVFKVLLSAEDAGKVIGVMRPAPLRMRWVAAAAIAVVIAGGMMAWLRPGEPREEPASVERMAFPLPDKPSIAVLPFTNMSDDASQEYFADGMTEDLITDLSKISGLFVIARNSSFVYKGRSVKVRVVAEELGVRYVLEGSVRRAGDQVRINAQLIDATTGGHLWAERYDGSLKDVFGLQDKVTQKVVAALAVKLASGEQAEGAEPETDNAEAYDAFLRGWSHYRRSTPDGYAKAIPYFEKAIELDPDYSRAHAALAALYWAVTDKAQSAGTNGWVAMLGISHVEAVRREQQNLQEAMKNPVPLAHRVASGRLSRQGRHEAAVGEAGRAMALDPNDPVAHEAMATALVYAGRPGEAVQHVRHAMRLDPQLAHEYLFWIGLAQFGIERYEDAAETLTRAAQSNPDDDRSLIVLAATYGHLGKVPEAKSAVDKANGLRSERQKRLTGTSLKAGIDFFLAGPYTQKDVDLWPFKEETDRTRLRKGLQLAGLPKAGKGKHVSPTEIAGATTVDPVAAKILFDRGVPFVDVRPDGRWNYAHISGAVNLSLKHRAFSEAALSLVAAKDQEVVIYCMGPRCLLSSKACAKAVGWGFEKVYYLREGLPGWKAAGYPVATQ